MILVAQIRSGTTGEDGPDFEDGNLPASYEKAMEPYVTKGSKAGPEICKNLSKLIGATIYPEDLSYFEDLFFETTPIEAFEVIVTGFHFDGNTNLPEVSAIARFKVKTKIENNPDLIDSLESDGETIGESVNFYWNFSDNPVSDWDGSLVNNSGISVEVV